MEWVKITVGFIYFINNKKEITASTKVSSEVKKENGWQKEHIIVKWQNQDYFTLIMLIKKPIQAEVNKYNKEKHTHYSLQDIKTRLWRASEYVKSGNVDHYVTLRRMKLLKEFQNIRKKNK